MLNSALLSSEISLIYSKLPLHREVQVAIKSLLYHTFQILKDKILNFLTSIIFPIWYQYLVSYLVPVPITKLENVGCGDPRHLNFQPCDLVTSFLGSGLWGDTCLRHTLSLLIFVTCLMGKMSCSVYHSPRKSLVTCLVLQFYSNLIGRLGGFTNFTEYLNFYLLSSSPKMIQFDNGNFECFFSIEISVFDL